MESQSLLHFLTQGDVPTLQGVASAISHVGIEATCAPGNEKASGQNSPSNAIQLPLPDRSLMGPLSGALMHGSKSKTPSQLLHWLKKM